MLCVSVRLCPSHSELQEFCLHMKECSIYFTEWNRWTQKVEQNWYGRAVKSFFFKHFLHQASSAINMTEYSSKYSLATFLTRDSCFIWEMKLLLLNLLSQFLAQSKNNTSTLDTHFSTLGAAWWLLTRRTLRQSKPIKTRLGQNHSWTGFTLKRSTLEWEWKLLWCPSTTDRKQETSGRAVWTKRDPCQRTGSGSNDAAHNCDLWLEIQRQFGLRYKHKSPWKKKR